MLLNLMKKSFLWEIACFVRDVYRCPGILNCSYKLRHMKHAYCVLLGTPAFNNLGDHLIALAELDFLKNYFPNYEVFEIPTPIYLRLKKKLKRIIPKDVPIFITGGGWMGNIWQDDEYRMQDMLRTFKEHSITIFPQTVYYEKNNPESAKILEHANLCYTQCRNLKLFLRDYDSYIFAKQKFKINDKHIYLVPDIALWYAKNNINVKKPTKRLLICLRKDRENIEKPQLNHWIKKFVTESEMNLRQVDTVIQKAIPIWKRRNKVERIVNEFCNADIVITDRLHGLIISVIAGTKCMVFNNTTNKVFGVYKQWLNNNTNICCMDNNIMYSEFVYNLKVLMKNPIVEKNDYGNIYKHFNYMADAMRRDE